MAADTSLLMGEVIENPEGQERNVELLLTNLLRSLIEEQSQLDSSQQQKSNRGTS